MPYCTDCGFYYEDACTTCDDDEGIQNDALDSHADREDEFTPSPDGWILVVLATTFVGIAFAYMYTDGIELDYLVLQFSGLGLYVLAIDRELRYIYDHADTNGWQPNSRDWYALAAGVVGTAGLLALVVTPYYLYCRFNHVQPPEETSTTDD